MSVPAAYGPYVASAGLLLIGGALKLVSPADTANALRATGWPSSPLLVRLGAAAEVAIAAAALAAGGRVPAALVALSYAGFAAFVLAALRRGSPVSSCGCFGEVDAPPTFVHVVLCLAMAGVAVVMVIQNPPDIVTALSHQPWAGIPFVILTVLAAYLAFLAMAVLPRTMAASRGDTGIRGSAS
jgi:hypothetical protein